MIWKERNNGKLFLQINETKWDEIQNDEFRNSFEFVAKNENCVVLFSVDRNFYVSLNPGNAKFSENQNEINTIFCYGDWKE